MSRSVLLTHDAEHDLDRLGDFLIDKNPRAAARAMLSVRQAAATLADLAERGRLAPRDDLRELVVRVGGGPYIIEYRVYPDRAVIFRIWHAREDRQGLAPDAG